MRTNMRLAVVSAAGAVMGGLLVHEFALVHWAIGALIGALTAYLLQDAGAVREGVETAAQQVRWFVHKDSVEARRGALNLLVLALLVSGVLYLLDHRWENPYLWVVVFYLVTNFALFWFGVLVSGFFGDEPPLHFREMCVQVARSQYKGWRGLGKLLFWDFSRYLWIFLTRLFRIIHTDARTVVAVAAATGMAIGHFAGQSTLLGGLVAIPVALIEWRLVRPRLQSRELAQEGVA